MNIYNSPPPAPVTIATRPEKRKGPAIAISNNTEET